MPLVFWIGPASRARDAKPVDVPDAAPLPKATGWLRRCSSSAQPRKPPFSMSTVRSAFESGGTTRPSAITPAMTTTPLSQKSQRASLLSLTRRCLALSRCLR